MKKNIAVAASALLLAGGCCMTGGRCAKGPVPFGTTQDGEKAHLWTLAGKGGLTMQVTDCGGKVVRLFVPDSDGVPVDVTIGFDDVSGWENTDPYFGAIIGRYGNRISKGKFTLDGVEYTIGTNDSSHDAALHGGPKGWNAYVWDAERFDSENGDTGIVFRKTFPDGEQGFPGTVTAEVRYTITPDNVWRIEYTAETDKATPINLTQHVYFNMNGLGTILDQYLTIAAEKYLPVDANLAPCGKPQRVEGTPFDFREPKKIGTRIDFPDEVLQYGPGYDHNWCLDGSGFRKVAELKGERRSVEVWTDQPGLQFYAGNFIDNAWKMKDGLPMRYRGWLALETQHYPDSPNRPDFPSTVLRPGETYKTVTEYRFKAQ